MLYVVQVNVCNVYYKLCYLAHVGVTPLWGVLAGDLGKNCWFCVAKERVFNGNSCASFLIAENATVTR